MCFMMKIAELANFSVNVFTGISEGWGHVRLRISNSKRVEVSPSFGVGNGGSDIAEAKKPVNGLKPAAGHSARVYADRSWWDVLHIE